MKEKELDDLLCLIQISDQLYCETPDHIIHVTVPEGSCTDSDIDVILDASVSHKVLIKERPNISAPYVTTTYGYGPIQL